MRGERFLEKECACCGFWFILIDSIRGSVCDEKQCGGFSGEEVLRA